jgi:hypothetical protein
MLPILKEHLEYLESIGALCAMQAHCFGEGLEGLAKGSVMVGRSVT